MTTTGMRGPHKCKCCRVENALLGVADCTRRSAILPAYGESLREMGSVYLQCALARTPAANQFIFMMSFLLF